MMIGPGLQKLGQELNLKPSGGKLCGIIQGFPAALWEGVGYKAVTLGLGSYDKEGVKPPDPETLLTKPRTGYRIIQYATNGPVLAVVFYDTIGTMKRIRAYLEAELPALRNGGFTGAAKCAKCGEAMGDETPALLMLGENPIAVHERCAYEAQSNILQSLDEKEREERIAETELRHSTPLAPVGAVLGGIVGSLPWILLTVWGYVASIAAVLIALCASYGYKLFGGRPGKKKLVLVIVLTILLVPVAHVAGTICQFAYQIHTGEIQTAWGIPQDALVPSDAPGIFLEIFADPEGRAELMGSFAKDFAMAYLFTALGLWAVWRKLASENLKPKRAKLSRIA